MKLSTITKQSYTEVNKIVNLLDKADREKILIRLREYFERERDSEYVKEIDATIPLKDQGLKKETIAIMAMLHLNYICDDENEKRILQEKYERNEVIYQKELSEKYNINNIFKENEEILIKNNESPLEIEEEKSLVVIRKEGILIRFVNLIKRLFNK